MKQIPLSQGKLALVDDEDFEELNKYKWRAIKDKNTFYAVRTTSYKKEGCITTIRMHRVILDLKSPKILCDHKDRDGLNNQKQNLRKATHAQNSVNTESKKNTSSKYKGVTWSKASKKWRSNIEISGSKKHIGLFKNEIEAAKAYDKMAKIYHGEFACLNFKTKKTTL
jgi:hypothetical protein